MNKLRQISPRTVKILIVALTAALFLVDYFMPDDLNVAIFYACVIVMLAWTQSARWLWIWTLVIVVLTILDPSYDTTVDQTYTWLDRANRYITAFMLVTVAGFAHFSLILTAARKQAEESLRKAQEDLAHVSRVTTMGELAASLAHELNQPLSGVVLNANACLRWLANEKTESSNLDEAREATQRIVRDGKRAGDVIARLRSFFKKTITNMAALDLNETIREVSVLTRSELEGKRVTLRLELAYNLPHVSGDRVQLQQVLLNLILNGAEAMSEVEDRARKLIVRTNRQGQDEVLVEVIDSGIGLDAEKLQKIFDAFYTTKSAGMGMGLSISRSIIENHGGKLTAKPNEGPGATFQFTVLQHH